MERHDHSIVRHYITPLDTRVRGNDGAVTVRGGHPLWSRFARPRCPLTLREGEGFRVVEAKRRGFEKNVEWAGVVLRLH